LASTMASDPVDVLDVRGVPSPVYLLRVDRTMSQAQPGSRIEVLTDPVKRFLLEIKILATQRGHTLVEQIEADDVYRHVLQRR
jgi:TusA-related sulfurtransferase